MKRECSQRSPACTQIWQSSLLSYYYYFGRFSEFQRRQKQLIFCPRKKKKTLLENILRRKTNNSHGKEKEFATYQYCPQVVRFIYFMYLLIKEKNNNQGDDMPEFSLILWIWVMVFERTTCHKCFLTQCARYSLSLHQELSHVECFRTPNYVAADTSEDVHVAIRLFQR